MTKARSLFLFDVDGTLLDHDKRLPASAKESIEALRRAGHEIAIASGRSPFMLAELTRELGIDSYVGFNGQYVVMKGEVIYANPIGSDVLHDLAQFAANSQHPLVYLNQEMMRSSIPEHAYVETCIHSLQYDYPELDPEFHLNHDIYQTMLFCTEDEEQSYRDQFQNLEFVRWHPFSMDILPAGGSKAIGAEQLMRRLGFSPEQTYAFGDNLNDMEMFRYVSHSVAMGNAANDLKKIARYVTTDVDRDGIANALRMLEFIS